MSSLELNGNTPTVATFGVQGDISNICRFGWYDWCYFREESNTSFPFQKIRLGRVLGPIQNEGNEMAQAVLLQNGIIVPRRTLRPLTVSELHSESEKTKRQQFDDDIRKKFGNSLTLPTPPIPQDDEETPDVTLDNPINAHDPVDAQEKDVYGMPLKDMSIETGVSLHQGEDTGVVKQYAAEVSSMKTNPKRTTHKYGIEVPTSLDHAKRIDERNKITLWSDVM